MTERPYRELDLANPDHRDSLLARLHEMGVQSDPAALSYSLSILSDDWRRLPEGLEICSLKVGTKRSEGIGLPVWLAVMQSVYDFRSHPRFDQLVHRLRLPSHEKLDTVLVLQVARRYHARGFEITFEPFDHATTDLLVQRELCRLYIEIKRENPTEHRRFVRVHEIGNIITGTLDQVLRPWFRERHVRLEVSIPKLFSDAYAKRFAEEICTAAPTLVLAAETHLQSAPQAKVIILPEDAEFLYRKGIHMGFVRVEADHPVPIFAPASSPIRCTFALKPKLDALGERIRHAGKQLKRDLQRDKGANGFVVLESWLAEKETVDAIQHRFWQRLPAGCLGVVLISPTGWIIPHPSLQPEAIEVLKYAATEP